MAYDAHKNFATSLVATAPSPATSGTSLVVTAADGALFPAVPFNATIWPAGAKPTSTNAEIVRVTARSTDTLTITRAQESTTARTVIIGDQIAATVTAKTLTDVELISNFQADTTNAAVTTPPRMEIGWGVITPGVANNGNETVTFATAFNARPVVLITDGGDAVSATTYGSGGNTIKGGAVWRAHTVTTTSFVAKAISQDSTNYASGNTIFYQWIAVGN